MNITSSLRRGFSMVELLVVAVIGIMAAIAIPMISNINANAEKAKQAKAEAAKVEAEKAAPKKEAPREVQGVAN